MATPSDQQEMDETTDTESLTDPQQPYSDSMDYDHQTEGGDGQYHEVGTVHHVPTKSGEEDAMQVDSDRPGSAGTGLSVPLPEDDEQFLANTAAPSKQETEPFVPQPIEAKVFARPGLPSESEEASGFSFGQFKKQQMDMVGTRKVPPPSGTSRQPGSTRLEIIQGAVDQDTQGT